MTTTRKEANRERRLADLGAQTLRVLCADDRQDALNRIDAIRECAVQLGLATMHDGCDDSDPYLDAV